MYNQDVTSVTFPSKNAFRPFPKLYVEQLKNKYSKVGVSDTTAENVDWWKYLKNYAERNNFSFSFLYASIQDTTLKIKTTPKSLISFTQF